jgi:hypothetical protein
LEHFLPRTEEKKTRVRGEKCHTKTKSSKGPEDAESRRRCSCDIGLARALRSKKKKKKKRKEKKEKNHTLKASSPSRGSADVAVLGLGEIASGSRKGRRRRCLILPLYLLNTESLRACRSAPRELQCPTSRRLGAVQPGGLSCEKNYFGPDMLLRSLRCSCERHNEYMFAS